MNPHHTIFTLLLVLAVPAAGNRVHIAIPVRTCYGQSDRNKSSDNNIHTTGNNNHNSCNYSKY